MLSFSEQIIHGILILSAALFLVSVGLIVYALGRRTRHEKDFRALDDFRRRLRAVFAALREGAMDYKEARAQVSVLLRPRLELRMEQILLEHLWAPADQEAVKRLAKDLGCIHRWRQSLEHPAGRRACVSLSRLRAARSFTRAKNAENLGLVKHRESWSLLCQSLDDSHADVRRAVLRALAALGEPASLPALVEYIKRTAGHPENPLSGRDLAAALACFPLESCRDLLPLLHHADVGLRRLALEAIVHMMATRHDLLWLDDSTQGAAIAELILSPLAGDRDAEIRARGARLLGHIHDDRALAKLRRLLNDEAWIVRLHSVRSLSRRQLAASDPGALSLLAARLTDEHWRVRESAAQALAQWGKPGVAQLVRVFLSTRDAYAREQIAETLATSGELALMVSRCKANGAGPEFDALKKIRNMGKAGSFRLAIEALMSGRNVSQLSAKP